MALRTGDEGEEDGIIYFSTSCISGPLRASIASILWSKSRVCGSFVRAIVDVPIVVMFNQRHDRLLFGEEKNESSHAGDV